MNSDKVSHSLQNEFAITIQWCIAKCLAKGSRKHAIIASTPLLHVLVRSRLTEKTNSKDTNKDLICDINGGAKLAVKRIRKLPEGTTDDVPGTGSRKTQAKR